MPRCLREGRRASQSSISEIPPKTVPVVEPVTLAVDADATDTNAADFMGWVQSEDNLASIIKNVIGDKLGTLAYDRDVRSAY